MKFLLRKEILLMSVVSLITPLYSIRQYICSKMFIRCLAITQSVNVYKDVDMQLLRNALSYFRDNHSMYSKFMC